MKFTLFFSWVGWGVGQAIVVWLGVQEWHLAAERTFFAGVIFIHAWFALRRFCK